MGPFSLLHHLAEIPGPCWQEEQSDGQERFVYIFYVAAGLQQVPEESFRFRPSLLMKQAEYQDLTVLQLQMSVPHSLGQFHKLFV